MLVWTLLYCVLIRTETETDTDLCLLSATTHNVFNTQHHHYWWFVYIVLVLIFKLCFFFFNAKETFFLNLHNLHKLCTGAFPKFSFIFISSILFQHIWASTQTLSVLHISFQVDAQCAALRMSGHRNRHITNAGVKTN